MYKRSRLRIKLEVSRAQIWDTIRLAYILWYKRRFEQARRPEPWVQVWKWYYNSQCTSMMHDVEEYIRYYEGFEQRYQSWTCNHVPKLTLWTVKYHRRNERSRTSCCMFTVKRKINQVLPKLTTIELVSLKKDAHVQKVKFKAPTNSIYSSECISSCEDDTLKVSWLELRDHTRNTRSRRQHEHDGSCSFRSLAS